MEEPRTHTTDDGLELTLTKTKPPERKEYVVVAESGLFKNGREYAKGDKVKLDQVTAERFLKQEGIKNV